MLRLFPSLVLASACILSTLVVQSQAASKQMLGPNVFTMNDSSTQALKPSSFLQQATAVGCTSASDCLAKCPTTNFVAAGNVDTASIGAQLGECSNAMRTAPEVFASAISAVCSFSDFQGAITNPRRSPLGVNSQLTSVAEAHSIDMANNNYFSHYSQNGESPADRIRAVIPAANTLGEVIAAGYDSVLDVIVGFMCSSEHRAILTDCAYDSIGWGLGIGQRSDYTTYFTGDIYCSVVSGCSCPPNAPEFAAAAAPQGSAAAALSPPPVVQSVSPPPSQAASPPPKAQSPLPQAASPPPQAQLPPRQSASPPPQAQLPPPQAASPPPQAGSSPPMPMPSSSSPPSNPASSSPPITTPSPSKVQFPPPVQQAPFPPPPSNPVSNSQQMSLPPIPPTALPPVQAGSVECPAVPSMPATCFEPSGEFIGGTQCAKSIEGQNVQVLQKPGQSCMSTAGCGSGNVCASPGAAGTPVFCYPLAPAFCFSGPSLAPSFSQNSPASPPVPEDAESVSSTQQSQPPPASPPPSPTSAIAISFDITFNSIATTSLTQSQIQQVIQDVRGAIKTYAYPAVVGVSVNGSSPASAPSQGRRLLQSPNTVQATVQFTLTTSVPSSSNSNSIINEVTSAINTFVAPTSVTTTATPVTTGSTLALTVQVQYPPNNQVATATSYTTELADIFASAVANQTSTVFSSLISQSGAVSTSGIQVVVKPVYATAASNLGPPAPITVPGAAGAPQAAEVPSTASSPPTAPQGPMVPVVAATPPVVASPPSLASLPPPVSASSPPAASLPPPVSSSPPPAASLPPSVSASPPPAASLPPPVSASPPPAALPPPPMIASPAPTTALSPPLPVLSPPPPYLSQASLVLSVIATFPGNESDLVQNITAALQSDPQAVLYALIASDGQVTVTNIQTSNENTAAIESASPLPSAALPLASPSIAPLAAVAPSSQNGSCSFYALNMQYTTGMAATDQTSAVLLAGFPTAGGPQATSFIVALEGGLSGSVSAIAPYSSSYYLVRVSTPDGYIGSVTVSYRTSQLEPLKYYVVPSLVVKVTASSLSSLS